MMRPVRFWLAASLVVGLGIAPARAGVVVPPDDVIRLCKGKLAAYKAPKHVIVVERVLRSPAGKADYRWALETAKRRLGME